MFRNTFVYLALWLCLACTAGVVRASQLAPESADELAAAPRIVVADLESTQSRWNPQRTLIVTDYTFRRVETLRGTFDSIFVLTQGGGTVGDETHRLSDLPELRSGVRYLLLLNAADNPVFSSVRYGAAGAIEIDRSSGRLHGGGELAVFRAQVLRTAVIDDAALRPAPSGKHYPARAWRLDGAPAVRPVQHPSASGDMPMPPERDRSAAGTATLHTGFADATSPHFSGNFLPDYLVQRWPAPTIAFDPLPLTWVWSPADQNMMAEWNRYGDIFRVYQTPSSTWAWTNGRYELAGFPSDADMLAQFGAPWGASTLAICYTRWSGNGPIIEADIALNPAFDWTLDDAFGTENNSSPWSFRQSLQHELGHSWGLKHPWETQNVFWPSTMNYGPKWARDPALHSDDAAAIHSVYPGINPHDGSLAMYRTSDNASSNHATYAASATLSGSYTHGQSVSFAGAVTLQNLGTSNIVNPAVDVYLSATRRAYASTVYLGRSTYTITLAPFPNSLATLILGSYFLSSTVPTGIYYPVIYLATTGGTDAFPANNSAWGLHEFPVTINNVTGLLLPTPLTQYTGTGRIGPRGQWTYRVNAQAGHTYHFSTCGLASFNTVIAIYGSFPTVGNDDACGAQSDIYWRSATNQTVTVIVSGFGSADQGSFQLSYAGDNERLLVHGFEF